MEIISDQWQYLKEIAKISLQELDKLYKALIENDELQTDPILLTKNKATSEQLNVIMGNTIKLPKISLRPQLVKFLREKLNFFNTEYLVKEKIGIRTYQ